MSSKEDYLREIFVLTEGGDSKTSTSELAREMDVTNASVSEAVQKLEQEKLVCRAAYKGFTLSPMGKEEASKLSEKHRRLEKIFSQLEVEDPEQEADSVEHSISLEAVEKLEDEVL
ncbi:metal-dependent transcriptional regulator [Candidatus Nanosalina sp. VS9-1]|uniref:metal-dependent transcriptional regulator n=1 Tax=Candidatus Nanosalina sp. VS9-1 TaxID=3388566 RepID=UPI0039E0CE40